MSCSFLAREQNSSANDRNMKVIAASLALFGGRALAEEEKVGWCIGGANISTCDCHPFCAAPAATSPFSLDEFDAIPIERLGEPTGDFDVETAISVSPVVFSAAEAANMTRWTDELLRGSFPDHPTGGCYDYVDYGFAEHQKGLHGGPDTGFTREGIVKVPFIALLRRKLSEAILPMIAQRYPRAVPDASELRVVAVQLLRYNQSHASCERTKARFPPQIFDLFAPPGEQAPLMNSYSPGRIHNDPSLITLNFALNDPSEFQDGGVLLPSTRASKAGAPSAAEVRSGAAIARVGVGRALMHPGWMTHGTSPLTGGVRQGLQVWLKHRAFESKAHQTLKAECERVALREALRVSAGGPLEPEMSFRLGGNLHVHAQMEYFDAMSAGGKLPEGNPSCAPDIMALSINAMMLGYKHGHWWADEALNPVVSCYQAADLTLRRPPAEVLLEIAGGAEQLAPIGGEAGLTESVGHTVAAMAGRHDDTLAVAMTHHLIEAARAGGSLGAQVVVDAHTLLLKMGKAKALLAMLDALCEGAGTEAQLRGACCRQMGKAAGEAGDYFTAVKASAKELAVLAANARAGRAQQQMFTPALPLTTALEQLLKSDLKDAPARREFALRTLRELHGEALKDTGSEVLDIARVDLMKLEARALVKVYGAGDKEAGEQEERDSMAVLAAARAITAAGAASGSHEMAQQHAHMLAEFEAKEAKRDPHMPGGWEEGTLTPSQKQVLEAWRLVARTMPDSAEAFATLPLISFFLAHPAFKADLRGVLKQAQALLARAHAVAGTSTDAWFLGFVGQAAIGLDDELAAEGFAAIYRATMEAMAKAAGGEGLDDQMSIDITQGHSLESLSVFARAVGEEKKASELVDLALKNFPDHQYYDTHIVARRDKAREEL